MARQPQRSEYSDLHTHCQAFTISGRIAMSAGRVSAGFLFLGATPTDCGNDRDAEESAPQEVPVLFLPKCRKALRIFFEKGGNQMKTRKKWRPGGRQRQSAAYHRRAVHKRKRVVRLRVWKKGEKNGAELDV